MKILIFEWLSGGGLWLDRKVHDPDGAIRLQGERMLEAITQDFLAAGVDVVIPLDGRGEDRFTHRIGMEKHVLWATDELPACLVELAEQVDHILLIAPESNSCLLACLEWLHSFSAKLICPGNEFVRIASNKQTTIDCLRANGFRSVPNGLGFAEFQPGMERQIGLPAVIKPIDGAGSDGVKLIDNWKTWNRIISQSPEHYRLEQFIDGIPVSVSVLCGPREYYCLPPSRQLFDQLPFGNYVGAGFPLDPALAWRAGKLAKQAIRAMPPTQGYVGIDMVLSDRSETGDCLIEINPRLTMSYLKLREVCHQNLALLMLEIASGSRRPAGADGGLEDQ